MIESNAIPSPKTDTPRSLRYGSFTYLQAILAVALATGLVLRLIGLHYPPYDSHSFRQCQTLSTIEDFHRNGIDLLHPHTLYMGHPGVFVLELPLFQAVGAALYHVFGAHVEVIRVLNILFGVGSAWIVYLLTLRWVDRATAVLATLIFWLSPLNILYHRSTLLDPMAVFCALGSFYSLAILLEDTRREGRTTRPWWVYFLIFILSALLTALIKALYLWPAVLFLGQALFIRRFRFDSSLFGILAAFALAGVCFVCWNQYAALANATNPVTGGIKPASLLGISELLDPRFYSVMLRTRPKMWLGPLGAVLYLTGFWAWWKARGQAGWRSPLLLVLIVPPTYLLAFSNINFPHEYYQLVITPFLAITSATGVCWIANRLSSAHSTSLMPKFLTITGCILILSNVVTYVAWLKWPRLDGSVLTFEKLSAGKFEPWAPTILFSSPGVTGATTNSYLPAFLYAGRLWGYGWSVSDAVSAKTIFGEARRGFDRLDYVVFYGTEQPTWLSADDYQLTVRDDEHRFFVFQTKRRDANGGKQ